ncbi:MAG: epoxyqueuosine reductase QueH [Thermodesulfobacteriota bacterium]
MEGINGLKPGLLLHICCAPCSTHVVEVLSQDFDLVGYFLGPNIHPEEEYRRRLKQAENYCQRINLSLVSAPYQPERWFQSASDLAEEPEGGRRCDICHRLRLDETARFAKERGFDYFATTLTISPHKRASVINAIGRRVAAERGVEFFAADFKKKDGFKKSLEITRRLNIYRQDYCGCLFSLRERQQRQTPAKVRTQGQDRRARRPVDGSQP